SEVGVAVEQIPAIAPNEFQRRADQPFILHPLPKEAAEPWVVFFAQNLVTHFYKLRVGRWRAKAILAEQVLPVVKHSGIYEPRYRNSALREPVGSRRRGVQWLQFGRADVRGQLL